MKKAVPPGTIAGVELVPTETPGIHKVIVNDRDDRFSLTWDRFVRLKAAAEAIERIAGRHDKIIDVGGFDGALGMFLDGYQIDLVDPATTGATLLQRPAEPLSYDVVVSIDALEHIDPAERQESLQELAGIARRFVVLNYPCRETREAQSLVLKATNNPLVREHVQWELPDTAWVRAEMDSLGFSSTLTAHSSLAVWVGQYMTQNLAPQAAEAMNRYLIEQHADEPFSTPLYHLVVCTRR